MSSNPGYFERWRCLHDAIIDSPYDSPHEVTPFEVTQGPEARPIHIFAQYGLLTREIAEKERNIDIEGGTYGSALIAACWCGHPDAVGILLDLGADPKFGFGYALAPLCGALYRQDLPMLRQLLDHQQFTITWRERLNLLEFTYFREDHFQSDTFGAILALLFPEPNPPDSAIDTLYEVASCCTPRKFSFFLDKFDTSVVHEELLWRAVLSSSGAGTMSKVKVLLDRGGRIRITEAVVECLRENSSLHDAGPVLSLLLEYCDSEITENLIDSISCFSHSSQIVRTFKAKGYRFGPCTSKQLMHALQFGSAETATYFLGCHDGNTSAEEMLNSATENYLHGAKIVKLLFRYDSDTCIQEPTIIGAINNEFEGVEILRACCKHGKPLWCTKKIFEAAAHSRIGPHALKIILQQDRNANFSSSMIMFAMGAVKGAALISLMLDHDHMISINEEHLAAAASNLYRPRKIFTLLQTRGKFDITKAAAEDYNTRPAKCRRVSHSSLPCISTEVLNAAFSNPFKATKRELLELFIEWRIITEADVVNRMDVDDKLC